MTEFLKTNKTALRTCILYELAEGKSISEAYQHFCKVMGDDTMEYKDFEFWFMKFTKGDFRNLDTKLPTLSDLPIEILNIILAKTSWKDVLSFRQVSQNFREIVGDMKFTYKRVAFNVEDCKTTVEYDDMCTVFRSDGSRSHHGIIQRKQMIKAFQLLKILMKNPKILVETFEVNFILSDEDDIDIRSRHRMMHPEGCLARKRIEVRESLYKLPDTIDFNYNDSRFKVHRIVLNNCREFRFLRYVEPATLEEILINPKEQIDKKILKTDQWKMAKILTIRGYTAEILMKHMTHFVQFDVELKNLEMRDVYTLKMQLFKSKVFEKCLLKWSRYKRWDIKEFEDVEERISPFSQKTLDGIYRNYVIEQGNKTLEMKIGPTSVEIFAR